MIKKPKRKNLNKSEEYNDTPKLELENDNQEKKSHINLQNDIHKDSEQEDSCHDVEESYATNKSEPLQEEMIPLPVPLVSNGKWRAQYEAVVGFSHRKVNPPLPCQDSVIAMADLRPFIISADGAGSSRFSEIGSHYVTHGIARFYQTLENYISSLLDTTNDNEQQCKKFALWTVKHAKGILQDLAVEYRCSVKDFRCTLLLVVVGKINTLWIKVGDGALVIETMSQLGKEKIPQLETLGQVGKGEYANTTTFIDDYLKVEDVQYGCIPSNGLTAAFCMSDGAAEKLVSSDGHHVSKRLSLWAEQLRNGKLHRYKLTEAFYDQKFQNKHSGDDCSIAMIATELLLMES